MEGLVSKGSVSSLIRKGIDKQGSAVWDAQGLGKQELGERKSTVITLPPLQMIASTQSIVVFSIGGGTGVYCSLRFR